MDLLRNIILFDLARIQLILERNMNISLHYISVMYYALAKGSRIQTTYLSWWRIESGILYECCQVPIQKPDCGQQYMTYLAFSPHDKHILLWILKRSSHCTNLNASPPLHLPNCQKFANSNQNVVFGYPTVRFLSTKYVRFVFTSSYV